MTTTALAARIFGAFAIGAAAHRIAGLLGVLVVASLGVALFLHWHESRRGRGE